MTVTPLSIRREQGMKLADFSTGRGLEIGPLNQPLVTKDMADVRYVDVFSGPHLRAHYSQDPTSTWMTSPTSTSCSARLMECDLCPRQCAPRRRLPGSLPPT